jgi:capsular exopolysaccharide synthesis family protein
VLLAAAILGLLGGVALVLVLEQLDRSIRTRDQLEDLVGLPTFALIPQIKAGTGESAIQSYVLDHPSSSYAEALRMAWVGLQHIGGGGRIIVVTSSVPEEGKSLTCISLARVISALGLRVAVIDADLRRASIAVKSGIEPAVGIADVIRGTTRIEDAMMRDPLSAIDILPALPASFRDINLLAANEKVSELFTALRSRYDVIIVDSPPTLAVADVQVLARLADQTLFCVRWDQTPRETVLSAMRTMRDARAKVAGTLLTRVNIRKHARYGYYDIGHYYARYRSYYTER